MRGGISLVRVSIEAMDSVVWLLALEFLDNLPLSLLFHLDISCNTSLSYYTSIFFVTCLL